MSRSRHSASAGRTLLVALITLALVGLMVYLTDSAPGTLPGPEEQSAPTSRTHLWSVGAADLGATLAGGAETLHPSGTGDGGR